MDEILKVKDKILHDLDRDKNFYNVCYTKQVNAIELDHNGESFKLTIKKISPVV